MTYSPDPPATPPDTLPAIPSDTLPPDHRLAAPKSANTLSLLISFPLRVPTPHSLLCVCLTPGTQIPAPMGTRQQPRLPTRTARPSTSPPCPRKTRARSRPGAGADTAGTEPASSSPTTHPPLMAPSGKVSTRPRAPGTLPLFPPPGEGGEEVGGGAGLPFPHPPAPSQTNLSIISAVQVGNFSIK